ncbi:hypothetical protein CALCODRAFT_485407 [Calocera cornea HHB12733]|uniref:Uncharacterized protein n=1 Tax=Calocera cornea HHB12733 TaxID=1353952 RepID=A0A165C1Q9_9BASI|nr:hypothetical protein CALCODRAFT_488949 [Calocera cornea HHB12733]KZT54663.1 hypothetical protein CALCODRAFT_485407 [Calocera cornea HHB12733]
MDTESDADGASLLDGDANLDGPDQALISADKALVRTLKSPVDDGKKSISRSSSGSFKTVELDAKGTPLSDQPGISRTASSISHIRARPVVNTVHATAVELKLRPVMATAREEGVLNVLRATGTHFTAAGRAAMGDELGAMEEGRIAEDKNEGDLTDAEKKLGVRSAYGYASFKSFGGEIAAAFGTVRGFTAEEKEERAEKWKTMSGWERSLLAIQIFFGWILCVIAWLFEPVGPWVKANPRKALGILIVWIIALDRGVSVWTMVTTTLDSYKAKKA